MVNRRKDGSQYYEEQTITPLFDDQGAITHFIAIKLDITKRKHAELENARLLEAEMRARQTADTLRQVSLALSQSLDLEVVLNTLLENMDRLFRYDSANIALRETESHFFIHAARGAPPSASDTSRSLDTTRLEHRLLHSLIEKGESQLVGDIRRLDDQIAQGEADSPLSWIIVPMKTGEQILGCFFAGKNEPDFYTSEHLSLAETLVSQASVAVQNAWLFDQVRAGHARQQSLSRRLVTIQESERGYIARELHDEAGQALSSIMISLELLKESATRPQEVIESVGKLESLVNCLMEDLHRMAINLRPASLDHLGLSAALSQLIDSYIEKYRLKVDIEILGTQDRLPADVESALYRIIQEALTNVARHANASRVDIVIENHPEGMIMVIEDDGIGFSPEEKLQLSRIGLLGMRERAEMLGGKLLIESAPGMGTTLRVEIPVRADQPIEDDVTEAVEEK
jgi:signal transduction histidine kinase